MKYNRIKKTQPKRGQYWCDGCDRMIIEKGQKCPICGFKDTVSKHKRRNDMDNEIIENEYHGYEKPEIVNYEDIRGI